MSGKPPRLGLYFRRALGKPDIADQQRPLMRVAKSKGWKVHYVQLDEADWAPTRRGERPPGLEALLTEVSRGELEVVATTSVGALSRSLGDLLGILEHLQKHHVCLYVHEQDIDTGTAKGRPLREQLRTIVKWERSIIKERVGSGLIRARAGGTRVGRPPLEEKDPEKVRAVLAAIAKGRGVRSIAADLHVGVDTVRRLRDGRPYRPIPRG